MRCLSLDQVQCANCTGAVQNPDKLARIMQSYAVSRDNLTSVKLSGFWSVGISVHTRTVLKFCLIHCIFPTLKL